MVRALTTLSTVPPGTSSSESAVIVSSPSPASIVTGVLAAVKNWVQPVRLREDSRRKSKSCRGQTSLLRSLPGEAGHPHREYWPRRLTERLTGPILAGSFIPQGTEQEAPPGPALTLSPWP